MAKKVKEVAVTTKPVKAAKEPKVDDGSVKGNMLDTLKALKGGKAITHEAIAKITGKDKGNKLRELEEKGLVKKGEEEGVRGYVYQITPQGTKALAKS